MIWPRMPPYCLGPRRGRMLMRFGMCQCRGTSDDGVRAWRRMRACIDCPCVRVCLSSSVISIGVEGFSVVLGKHLNQNASKTDAQTC